MKKRLMMKVEVRGEFGEDYLYRAGWLEFNEAKKKLDEFCTKLK
jgi:hypothetical protein